MQRKMSESAFMKRYESDLTRLFAFLNARLDGKDNCLTPGCPGSIKNYKHLKSRKKDKSRKALLCPICLGHFHPLADGPFENCKLPLKLMFRIFYDVLSSPSGMTAQKIMKTHGVAYTTAHLFLHKIREHMGFCLPQRFVNTVIEVDESYISSGNKGMDRHYRFKRGRGTEKNSTVLSIVARGGGCLLLKIPDVQATTLISLIETYVDKSCIVCTDNLPAYRRLSNIGYEHNIVNHKSDDGGSRWVNGIASTNAAENSFSNLKRGIKGIYRSVSDEHLQNYLNEYAFKHTYRSEPDYGFEEFLKAMPSIRETYKLKKAA